MSSLKNPLSMKNYSDPFITYDDQTGYYYFMASCQSNILTMYRSKKIGDIIQKGESKDIYVCGGNGVYGPMWAPEMYKIKDRWYIYTSCQEKESDSLWDIKRLLILKSISEDPFDGFEFGSKPDTSIFAIDPSTIMIDGRQYICYSEVNEKGVQVLVMREMKDPLTFTDRQGVISYPTLQWELVEPYTGNNAINEGAFFIKKDHRLFIVYSANGCWSDDYCLGVLEYVGKDLCDAASWIKHPAPLLVKGNGVYGPGHATFFSSPDNSELWCAYHGLLRSNPKVVEMDRHTCVQKVGFDQTGYPLLGHPIKIGIHMDVPSGEK